MGLRLEKGSIDYNLYEGEHFLCAIKIMHGKGKKREVSPDSVRKIEKICVKMGLRMATKKEIDSHLKIALEEIGKIKPWFDKDVDAYVFEHPSYPVEYAGETEEDVIKGYPKYLREFIRHRLNNKLHPLMEKETKGRGGKRPGAGRPKGTKKSRQR